MTPFLPGQQGGAQPSPPKGGRVPYEYTSPDGRRGYAIHFMPGTTRYFKAGNHLCKQFVDPDLPDGAPCWEMGDHFPWVCKAGQPVAIQPPKQPNANSPLFEGETGDETWNGSRMWSRKE